MAKAKTSQRVLTRDDTDWPSFAPDWATEAEVSLDGHGIEVRRVWMLPNPNDPIGEGEAAEYEAARVDRFYYRRAPYESFVESGNIGATFDGEGMDGIDPKLVASMLIEVANLLDPRAIPTHVLLQRQADWVSATITDAGE